MKTILRYTLLLAIIICFTTCKKETVAVNPASQLPAATQTGANTFGCLINGVAFTPKGTLFGAPSLKCAYQFIQNAGYNFQLSANNSGNNSEDFQSVGIFTDSLRIDNGITIKLETNNLKNKAYGQYARYIIGSNTTVLYTSSTLFGELDVTKYDSIKQIVSGTFWYNVINSSGDTIKITDGRFDMQYTK